MVSYSFNKPLISLNDDFEFFFGIWNFESQNIIIDTQSLEEHPGITFSRGNNFFLCSSTFFSEKGPQSLISLKKSKNTELDAILFRGYILDPPIHSLSERYKILSYWNRGFDQQHNGVFSAVGVKKDGRTLEMVTDAFGIGPLYYRQFGQVVVFASSSRFLSCEGDKQDLISWRCLMQSCFIPGNRSLSLKINRIPPGTIVKFTNEKISENRWFDFAGLPDGTLDITSDDVFDVEEAFSTAISRCLKLSTQKRLLPLSSGYDSRRILAHFLKRKQTFHSVTIRGLDVQNRDIDAFFSARLAKDLNFSHQIYEMPTADQTNHTENTRRFCLDYESMMHAPFLTLFKKVNDSTLIFDGLCGDTLGHSGLKISRINETYKPEHRWIAENLLHPHFDSVLNKKRWPAHEEIVDDFINVIDPLPKTNNLIDLVMIMHRARRAASIASQQFAKPGHIVVYPYLDIDYVKIILQYSPIERFKNSLQAQCLEKFFNTIFHYPGSHSISKKLNISPQKKKFNINFHPDIDESKGFFPYVNQTKKFQYKTLGKAGWFIKHSEWWIKPMMDFSHRRNNNIIALSPVFKKPESLITSKNAI